MTTDTKADERRVCVDCDGEFILTTTDREFFERRALHLPRRCVACRKLRRLVNKAATGAPLHGVERR